MIGMAFGLCSSLDADEEVGKKRCPLCLGMVPDQAKQNTSGETKSSPNRREAERRADFTPRGFSHNKASSAWFLPNEAFYNADEKFSWWNGGAGVGNLEMSGVVGREMKAGRGAGEQRQNLTKKSR